LESFQVSHSISALSLLMMKLEEIIPNVKINRLFRQRNEDTVREMKKQVYNGTEVNRL
jgi:hypothetical protein